MDTFKQVYLPHINLVYPPLTPADGAGVADVLAAEQRLNTPLPDALRAFYFLVGQRADITNGYNHVLPLEKVYVADNVLVFLAEHQWVTLWGIRVQDCSIGDPIIYTTENTTTRDWQPIGDTVSVFLTATLYWQAVLGGLPYVGIGGLPLHQPQPLLTDFVQIPSGVAEKASLIYASDGKVVCSTVGADAYEIWAGGRTRDDFVTLDRLLNVAWDYCTLDDEREG